MFDTYENSIISVYNIGMILGRVMTVMSTAEAGGAVKRPVIIQKEHLVPFFMVTTLFLAWGLAGGLNDVLVRQFQKALAVSRTQSSFIQFAFYIGYTCAALPAGLLIRRYGYKAAILFGLTLYATGAVLFYPAAEAESFIVFLTALYIIAFGLAFLETASNPYISILGPAETSSSRLNLSQAFFCIGATLGPLVGGQFILSGIEHTPAELAAMPAAELAAYRTAEAHMVQTPYLVIAVLVVLLAVAIKLTPFPTLPAAPKADTRGSVFAVLRHPQLRYAIIAMFCYVGSQVAIWSFFIDFTKAVLPGMAEKTTAFLLSSSLMLMFFGRISGVFLQRTIFPARLLLMYCCISAVLCAVAMLAGGVYAVAALWLTTFFMAIIFPTVFTLGVANLGSETNLGASFLIMSLVGAALIPPFTGLVSERGLGIQLAMIVPLAGLLVCAAYAFLAPRLTAADIEAGN